VFEGDAAAEAALFDQLPPPVLVAEDGDLVACKRVFFVLLQATGKRIIFIPGNFQQIVFYEKLLALFFPFVRDSFCYSHSSASVRTGLLQHGRSCVF
jgi:hypothetical protein